MADEEITIKVNRRLLDLAAERFGTARDEDTIYALLRAAVTPERRAEAFDRLQEMSEGGAFGEPTSGAQGSSARERRAGA
ncbi:hypothetical protein ACPA54_23525 [Uniformispora flossi]|uniref:hypothetical protein n=1 Tax=Uniformispora flossi TaxID=3390723 RepID=UPI003C2DA308